MSIRRAAAIMVVTTAMIAAATTAVTANASTMAANNPAGAAPRAACAAPTAGAVRCLAVYRPSTLATVTAGTAPEGYGPDDLRQAYHLPTTGGTGQTIAVVVAYDNPNAEDDLAGYREQYGLPECTTANGCFRKVNQRGENTPLPEPDDGWALEAALDLDTASAVCPGCHLLLVEADNALVDNMAAAVDTAVRLGATVVSNSYGLDENKNALDAMAAHYNHPGVPIVAASGDSGFRTAALPAALPTVIAVGGTSLSRNGRGWSEQAWSGAGSGCSAWIDKPAWQHDTHCGKRTVADVAAVADPATGVAVHNTYGIAGVGWLVVGGTSASAPLISGVIALAGNHTRYNNASPLYDNAKSLFDVVGGSNGFCGGDYLCTGLTGYDAPTGNGTPNGTTAF